MDDGEALDTDERASVSTTAAQELGDPFRRNARSRTSVDKEYDPESDKLLDTAPVLKPRARSPTRPTPESRSHLLTIPQLKRINPVEMLNQVWQPTRWSLCLLVGSQLSQNFRRARAF